MKRILSASILFFTASAFAQENDSTKILAEVEVQAYLYKRSVSEAPASLGILTQSELDRFNNTGFLPVLNNVPGVKMEERSPGSYRLSIRGSSIRSPFGVRNVKVYRNNLPMTDAGGNTYLNVFDFSSVSGVELIKGPGGSLYGAGTGGVLLLNSRPRSSSGIEFSSIIGSYGLQRYLLRGDLSGKSVQGNVAYSRQQLNGYRSQTSTTRDSFNGDLYFSLGPSTSLAVNLLYTDLFYETPGGLTKAQFDEDPSQARPPSGMFNGAVEQNASVDNKTRYVGTVLDHEWSDEWSTNIGGIYSLTDFGNFAIANYEERDERNVGLRMENSYSLVKSEWKAKFSFGGEYLSYEAPIDVYENDLGQVSAQLYSDDLGSNQATLFAQAELDLPSSYFLTLGFSENWINYDFHRKFPEDQREEQSFSAVFSPRIAILKKLKNVSLYGSVSKGFSPPTLAEVRPSTNVFNGDLKPETGTNYEVGARHIGKSMTLDLTLYHFGLDETIVLERVENGAEYFVNAGATLQRGVELSWTWNASKAVKLWSMGSYCYYRFKDYVKYDNYVRDIVDYSGNELTGVPPLTATVGVDLSLPNGVYANAVYAYTDQIPLNDLNDEFADDYFLLNFKVGYRKEFSSKFSLNVFGAVDNVLNEKYSLGNDLNAAGRRFYNAAAPTNYSAGITVQIL